MRLRKFCRDRHRLIPATGGPRWLTCVCMVDWLQDACCNTCATAGHGCSHARRAAPCCQPACCRNHPARASASHWPTSRPRGWWAARGARSPAASAPNVRARSKLLFAPSYSHLIQGRLARSRRAQPLEEAQGPPSTGKRARARGRGSVCRFERPRRHRPAQGL